MTEVKRSIARRSIPAPEPGDSTARGSIPAVAEAGFRQEPEGLPARTIWLVGAGVVAISALLVVIAWLFVVPPPPPAHRAAPSTLEHGLFDHATGGMALRAAGEQRLERYQWIDRRARVVRIPIDRAIDAVLADPRLIGSPSAAIDGKVGQ
jgi:hypothetical protein